MKTFAARRIRYVLAAVALGVVTGCGGGSAPAPAPAPAPPATSVAPPPSSGSAAAPSRDQAFCDAFPETASGLRTVTGAIERGPVVPAAVALFLVNPRSVAGEPGIQDPELAAAAAELVGAIDELGAQGAALVPPGTNAAETTVELDAARLTAAVERIERACAARS